MANEVTIDEQGVREIENRATGAQDWLAAGRGWCDLERPDEARRCIATALEQPNADEHLISAQMVYTRLGDDAKAKEVLDRDLQVLIANPPKAQRWRDLTNHYVVDCKDLESARRPLELGLKALEPTVDNLCTFAMGYLKVEDVEMARSLLGRAEEIATADDWEIMFKTHSAAGNSARAQELLLQRIASRTTVEECFKLGHPAKREGEAMQRAVLARAQAIAATSKPEKRESEWSRIAQGYKDWIGDKAEIRRCLNHARDFAFSDTARAQVAHKLRFWVGERAIADEIAPWQPPSELLPPRGGQELDGWVADRSRLFEWLRPQLTDEVIATLAGPLAGDLADDGPVLRDIRDTGKLPVPMQAWSSMALGMHQHGRDGKPVDHLVRAIGCTLATFGPFPTVTSLPGLVESCCILGPEAIDGAIGLLVAVHESEWDHKQTLARVRLAVLILATARDPADPRLPALSAHVLADHANKPLVLKEPVWGRLLEGVPSVAALRAS